MSLDTLFVSRGGAKPAKSNAAPPRARATARRMVEETAREIVLDEAPDAQTLSPDERRVLSSRTDEGDDDDASHEQRRTEIRPPVMTPATGTPQLADGLFARRGDVQDRAHEDLVATTLPQNMADDLFRKPGAPASSSISSAQAVSQADPEVNEEEDSEDEVEFEADRVEKQRSLLSFTARCASINCPSVRCVSISQCEEALTTFLSSIPALPIRIWLPGCILLLILGFLTLLLSQGCQEEPLFIRCCVGADILQLVVTLMPTLLVLFSFAVYYRCLFVKRRSKQEKEWQHDGEAQKNAADVLDALVGAPSKERVKYVKQAVQILKDFPDKALIQQKGCAALESICRAERGNAEKVQAAGSIALVLGALERHLRVRAVQHAAMGALACLAKVSKKQIFDLGGSEIVLKSMAKFKRDAKLQVQGAMAVGAMCLASEQNRRSVVKYGGASLLLQALERFCDRADVLVAASETLVLLSKGDSGLRRQMVSSLEVVQGVIAKHEGIVGTDKARGVEPQRESEIVLKSLRKLEAQLCEMTTVPADDASDCSEVGTPHVDPAQDAAKVVQGMAGQVVDLQERYGKWKQKMPTSKK